MFYCNAQFINFENGTPGYTAYILLHRSLAVLSIILIFCARVFKEFIILISPASFKPYFI